MVEAFKPVVVAVAALDAYEERSVFTRGAGLAGTNAGKTDRSPASTRAIPDRCLFRGNTTRLAQLDECQTVLIAIKTIGHAWAPPAN
jgi:hypothetical protein